MSESAWDVCEDEYKAMCLEEYENVCKDEFKRVCGRV